MRKRLVALAMATPLALAATSGLFAFLGNATAKEPPAPAESTDRQPGPAAGSGAAAWTTAVDPKPLSAPVKKALAWLAEHQHRDGGWSQGEESVNMRGDETFRDTPDVADTCIAALALIRSGNTPSQGPYKDAVAKAVRFVRKQVDDSDAQSLAVTKIQGTRVQQKLGPNIDTFLASLLLAEVKGRMPDESGNKTVDLALNKVLAKIKANQKADGTWDVRTGWAPILAQSVGGKGLNRARQAGAMVSDELLAKTESYAKYQVAQAQAAPAAPVGHGKSSITAESPKLAQAAAPGEVDRARAEGPPARSGAVYGFSAMPRAGAAGVELYDRAASLGVLQDSINTNATLERDLKKKATDGKDEAERSQARSALKRFGEARQVHREAQDAVLKRLDDPQFVAGFGSNGGEEYLSYMNISESLVLKGGLEWKRWDDAMASNLTRIQNDDGSWSGHHCITGRTFCTSTALLVLMADRTPVPVSSKSGEAGPKK